MPRWLAIGKAPGWDEVNKLTSEMKATKNWRADARTSVTTVLALGDGRLVAECHGAEQKDFEAWLKMKGWTVESIVPIKYIANLGSIWDGQKP
ncbi:MAG: hypothetical protein HY680_07420 [Chloroflexi bacterium]|nr:hypothetical protein [Chloroflexota bacterium]